MPHFEELFAQVAGLEPQLPVQWGEIGGTLADQIDLQAALDSKASLAGAIFTGPVQINSTLGVSGLFSPTTMGAGGALQTFTLGLPHGATTPIVQVMGTNNSGASFGVSRFAALSAGADSHVILARSRGATVGDYTVVQSGDTLASISACGADGTGFVEAARIDFHCDGTPGTNDMPGSIVFAVSADGTADPATALTISSDLSAAFAGAVTVTGLATLPSLNSADGLQATKTANTSITPQWQMNGLTAAASAQGWNRWSNDTGGPNTIFSKSRGAAIGTHVVVADGDLLARIGFTGSDGTAFFEGARIAAQVDGTPAVGSVPGQLVLYTTAAAASAATPTLTLRADKTAEFAGAASVAGLFSPTTMGAGGALQVFPATTPNIQITGTSAPQASFGISRFNNAAGTDPLIVMGHSRGATVGSFTIVQADDTLASLSACGADGSAFAEAARIDFHVDGTPGAGDMPGRIVFSTSPDGTATPATVLTLKADKTAIFTGNVNATTTLVVGNSAAIPANTKALIDRIGSGTLPALTSGTALTLQGNNSVGNNLFLQLVAGTSGIAGIRFGDSGAAAQGRIDYDNATDSFDIRTAGTSRMTIAATTVTLAGLIAGSNITNTFTPTLTGVTNVSASTAFLSGWVRIGNAVFFFTRISVTATAAGASTQIDISLPIASNFTAVNQCVGTGSILDSSTEVATVGVQADTTNDRASAVFVSTSTSARVYTLMIGYFVL